MLLIYGKVEADTAIEICTPNWNILWSDFSYKTIRSDEKGKESWMYA